MAAPLEGVRVLDFSWVGAGSYATRILADHGADVIKVESMRRPDQTRLTPPFAGGVAGVNRSGYFADRNTSKRSLALNVKTTAGLDLAFDLARHCDIVANNFRPGTMERLGLGYDAVRQVRPDVIFLEMSMQGATGPHRHYLGYGLTIGALAGLHDLSGSPDREPIGTGTNYPDHVPSPGHAVVAILAALRHRQRTGEGQYIDVAQTEATVSAIGVAVAQAMNGESPPGRAENASTGELVDVVVPCRGDDRWLALSITCADDWDALVGVLGAAAEAFRRAWERAEPHGPERAETRLHDSTRAWDPWELMDALQRAGLAAGVVQHAGDVVDRDPQLAHRGHFVRLPHEEMGTTIYNRMPFDMTGTPCPIRRPAPRLGEHTEEILADVLGMDARACRELAEQGVLA